jgi:hypothetical protein
MSDPMIKQLAEEVLEKFKKTKYDLRDELDLVVAAPALAQALLEQQAEIERLKEYERMFNNYIAAEKQLRAALAQAAERER